jgi:hypothetical protein
VDWTSYLEARLENKNERREYYGRMYVHQSTKLSQGKEAMAAEKKKKERQASGDRCSVIQLISYLTRGIMLGQSRAFSTGIVS